MGVILTKGERLSLEKPEAPLRRICVGVSWGAISYRNWLGMKRTEPVDLDLAVALYHKDRSLIETVYYDKPRSKEGAVVHSGDDETGDLRQDDANRDNEVVTVDLSSVRSQVAHLVFLLHSYQWHAFNEIPYVRIRIYEGTPGNIERTLLKFDIENDDSFAGRVSMVLGKLYRVRTREGLVWRFHGIGEATQARELDDLRRLVSINYLSLDELTLLQSSVPEQFISGKMIPSGYKNTM